MSLQRILGKPMNKDKKFQFGVDTSTEIGFIPMVELVGNTIGGKLVLQKHKVGEDSTPDTDKLFAIFDTVGESGLRNAFRNEHIPQTTIFTVKKIRRSGMESCFENSSITDVHLNMVSSVDDWGLAHAFSNSNLGIGNYKETIVTTVAPKDGDVFKFGNEFRKYSNGKWEVVDEAVAPVDSMIAGSMSITKEYGYDFWLYSLVEIEKWSLYHIFEGSYVRDVHLSARLKTKYDQMITDSFGSWEAYLGCNGKVLFDADIMWTVSDDNVTIDPYNIWMWNSGYVVCDINENTIRYNKKDYTIEIINNVKQVTIEKNTYVIPDDATSIKIYNYPQNVVEDNNNNGDSNMWNSATRNKKAVL